MNWIETQDELPPENVRVLTCHLECTFNLLCYESGRWRDYVGGHSLNPPQYWCELVAPQSEVQHAWDSPCDPLKDIPEPNEMFNPLQMCIDVLKIAQRDATLKERNEHAKS